MNKSIDFSGILPEQPKDGLKRFRIQIDGIYGWSICYYTPEMQELFEKMCADIQSNLSEIITKRPVIYVERDGSSCSEIKAKLPVYKDYVYLHPMEFTGYLDEEDINNLCDYVNNFLKAYPDKAPSSHPEFRVVISFMEDTAHISTRKYEELIVEHSKDIIAKVNEFYKKLTPKQKQQFLDYGWQECGYWFVTTGRIKREGDSTGYSSSDTDWKLVNDIVKIGIDNGLIK